MEIFDKQPKPLPGEFLALAFSGCSAPLFLPVDGALAQDLTGCLLGWPQDEVDCRADILPLAASARLGEDRYAVQSRFTDRATSGLPTASAVCSLIADLSQDWTEGAPDMIGLHAGAVEINGVLVILTGPARAGKSTFTSRLALEPGARFFCDDVLPVDSAGRGCALGIAPRLRLPVPQGSDALTGLLAQHKLLSDDRYAYVDPPRRASHGTKAVIGAVIQLERRDDAAAGLYALAAGDAVSTLLRQSLTPFMDAEDAFSRVTALLAGLPCVRLLYSDLEEAIALLQANLPPLASSAKDLPALPKFAPDETSDRTDADGIDPSQVFTRRPDVVLRQIGDRSWLWLPEDAILWELNASSAAIWAMLEVPGDAVELAEALTEIFPEVGPDTLFEDVCQVLSTLLDAGLLER